MDVFTVVEPTYESTEMSPVENDRSIYTELAI